MTRRRRAHRKRAVDAPPRKAHLGPCVANPRKRPCVRRRKDLMKTTVMMIYLPTRIKIYLINHKGSVRTTQILQDYALSAILLTYIYLRPVARREDLRGHKLRFATIFSQVLIFFGPESPFIFSGYI